MTACKSPRNFLLCTWEGGGSVGPTVTLARKLLAAGHSVRVMSDECNRPEVEAEGAGFVAWTRAPNRPNRNRESELIRDWEADNPLDGFRQALADVFAGPCLAYAQDTIEELRREPADLVVANDFLLGVMAGCESIGQKHVALSANSVIFPLDDAPRSGPAPAFADEAEARQAMAMMAAFKSMFETGLPALNTARAVLGLQPLDSLLDQMQSPATTLIAISKHFDMAQDPVPAHFRYVGPQVDEVNWAQSWASPWPSEDTRPLVLVGFSTTFQNHASVLQRVVDAIATLPVRALVTLGPTISAGELDAAPNTVLVQSAPHNAVMREAALVVTHGGHGTVARAMLHDLPMLVIPHGRDQDGNAARIVAHGAGLMLPPTVESAAIAASIRRLLNEQSFREGARLLGTEVRRESEDSPIVEILEDLACPAYA